MSSDGGAGAFPDAEVAARPPDGHDGSAPRAAEYAAILRSCLGSELQPLIPFFAHPARLDVMGRLLDRHADPAPGRVLNVGCGPFASECFVRALHPHRIVSFDYTRGFVPAYLALERRGYLRNVDFLIGDATALEFRPLSFDLILMHDILYEPALDFERLLVKYDAYLRPGGLFYFTVLDRAARWLWKLLGQEKSHVRYSLPVVRARLERACYRVLDCLPASLETPNPANRMLKRALWKGLGLANQYAIVARKARA